jgi:S-adenosylmethionine decarboxylase
MNGLHITAELQGCAAALAVMTDTAALRRLCLIAVEQTGLTAVGELFHLFPAPGGITGVVLLAESHLAVHTWPELGAVTLDAYVCNIGQDNSARARQLVDLLLAGFKPQRVDRRETLRGEGVVQQPAAGR